MQVNCSFGFVEAHQFEGNVCPTFCSTACISECPDRCYICVPADNEVNVYSVQLTPPVGRFYYCEHIHKTFMWQLEKAAA